LYRSRIPELVEIFTQKIVTKLSKISVWDPGSGKNLFRIPDPGSRGLKSTGSRIRIRNTGNISLFFVEDLPDHIQTDQLVR
jgi:hypothetical protein